MTDHGIDPRLIGRHTRVVRERVRFLREERIPNAAHDGQAALLSREASALEYALDLLQAEYLSHIELNDRVAELAALKRADVNYSRKVMRGA